MEPTPTARPAPLPPPAGAAPAAAPAYYVPVPRRLAEDLRDAPAAVGAFALAARIFRASGQPVPLSPADLTAFDPALSYGAATRALKRLAEAGWLTPARRPGRKTTYTPSWGAVHGAPCPWRPADPCLGRPRHIPALRLDQRLLDVCMGRLTPHPSHPATAQRYMAAPLLGLRDVGAYALALAGLPAESAALAGLGLLSGGRPAPLPDEATILAVASQRPAHALSPAGWRRTPFAPAPQPAPGDPGQALFFVPPGQIGPPIGGVIADPITHRAPAGTISAASGRAAARTADDAAGSHGGMDQDGSKSTTPAQPTSGGGGDSPNRRTAGRSAPPREEALAPTPPAGQEVNPTPPVSESARLLQAAGVRRSVAASLAARPAAQVAHVIAQARARAGVRDLAAWVVSALRELPADTPSAPAVPERPPSALPIHTHPGLSDDQRDRLIRRFRAAASPAEQRRILAQLEEEHPR